MLPLMSVNGVASRFNTFQVYEVNRKLLQEHVAPLMAVYLHGVAVVREELNMDVSKKPVKGRHSTCMLIWKQVLLSSHV